MHGGEGKQFDVVEYWIVYSSVDLVFYVCVFQSGPSIPLAKHSL
jgi:hypothetical protein